MNQNKPFDEMKPTNTVTLSPSSENPSFTFTEPLDIPGIRNLAQEVACFSSGDEIDSEPEEIINFGKIAQTQTNKNSIVLTKKKIAEPRQQRCRKRPRNNNVDYKSSINKKSTRKRIKMSGRRESTKVPHFSSTHVNATIGLISSVCQKKIPEANTDTARRDPVIDNISHLGLNKPSHTRNNTISDLEGPDKSVTKRSIVEETNEVEESKLHACKYTNESTKVHKVYTMSRAEQTDDDQCCLPSSSREERNAIIASIPVPIAVPDSEIKTPEPFTSNQSPNTETTKDFRPIEHLHGCQNLLLLSHIAERVVNISRTTTPSMAIMKNPSTGPTNTIVPISSFSLGYHNLPQRSRFFQSLPISATLYHKNNKISRAVQVSLLLNNSQTKATGMLAIGPTQSIANSEDGTSSSKATTGDNSTQIEPTGCPKTCELNANDRIDSTELESQSPVISEKKDADIFRNIPASSSSNTNGESSLESEMNSLKIYNDGVKKQSAGVTEELELEEVATISPNKEDSNKNSRLSASNLETSNEIFTSSIVNCYESEENIEIERITVTVETTPLAAQSDDLENHKEKQQGGLEAIETENASNTESVPEPDLGNCTIMFESDATELETSNLQSIEEMEIENNPMIADCEMFEVQIDYQTYQQEFVNTNVLNDTIIEEGNSELRFEDILNSIQCPGEAVNAAVGRLFGDVFLNDLKDAPSFAPLPENTNNNLLNKEPEPEQCSITPADNHDTTKSNIGSCNKSILEDDDSPSSSSSDSDENSNQDQDTTSDSDTSSTDTEDTESCPSSEGEYFGNLNQMQAKRKNQTFNRTPLEVTKKKAAPRRGVEAYLLKVDQERITVKDPLIEPKSVTQMAQERIGSLKLSLPLSLIPKYCQNSKLQDNVLEKSPDTDQSEESLLTLSPPETSYNNFNYSNPTSPLQKTPCKIETSKLIQKDKNMNIRKTISKRENITVSSTFEKQKKKAKLMATKIDSNSKNPKVALTSSLTASLAESNKSNKRLVPVARVSSFPKESDIHQSSWNKIPIVSKNPDIVITVCDPHFSNKRDANDQTLSSVTFKDVYEKLKNPSTVSNTSISQSEHFGKDLTISVIPVSDTDTVKHNKISRTDGHRVKKINQVSSSHNLHKKVMEHENVKANSAVDDVITGMTLRYVKPPALSLYQRKEQQQRKKELSRDQSYQLKINDIVPPYKNLAPCNITTNDFPTMTSNGIELMTICPNIEEYLIDEEDGNNVPFSISPKDPSMLQCDVCNKVYNYPREVTICLQSHNKQKCWICGQLLLITKDAFKTHNLLVHRSTTTIQCPFCKVKLPLTLRLKHHIEKIHWNLEDCNLSKQKRYHQGKYRGQNKCDFRQILPPKVNSGKRSSQPDFSLSSINTKNCVTSNRAITQSGLVRGTNSPRKLPKLATRTSKNPRPIISSTSQSEPNTESVLAHSNGESNIRGISCSSAVCLSTSQEYCQIPTLPTSKIGSTNKTGISIPIYDPISSTIPTNNQTAQLTSFATAFPSRAIQSRRIVSAQTVPVPIESLSSIGPFPEFQQKCNTIGISDSDHRNMNIYSESGILPNISNSQTGTLEPSASCSRDANKSLHLNSTIRSGMVNQKSLPLKKRESETLLSICNDSLELVQHYVETDGCIRVNENGRIQISNDKEQVSCPDNEILAKKDLINTPPVYDITTDDEDDVNGGKSCPEVTFFSRLPPTAPTSDPSFSDQVIQNLKESQNMMENLLSPESSTASQPSDLNGNMLAHNNQRCLLNRTQEHIDVHNYIRRRSKKVQIDKKRNELQLHAQEYNWDVHQSREFHRFMEQKETQSMQGPLSSVVPFTDPRQGHSIMGRDPDILRYSHLFAQPRLEHRPHPYLLGSTLKTPVCNQMRLQAPRPPQRIHNAINDIQSAAVDVQYQFPIQPHMIQRNNNIPIFPMCSNMSLSFAGQMPQPSYHCQQQRFMETCNNPNKTVVPPQRKSVIIFQSSKLKLPADNNPISNELVQPQTTERLSHPNPSNTTIPLQPESSHQIKVPKRANIRNSVANATHKSDNQISRRQISTKKIIIIPKSDLNRHEHYVLVDETFAFADRLSQLVGFSVIIIFDESSLCRRLEDLQDSCSFDRLSGILIQICENFAIDLIQAEQDSAEYSLDDLSVNCYILRTIVHIALFKWYSSMDANTKTVAYTIFPTHIQNILCQVSSRYSQDKAYNESLIENTLAMDLMKGCWKKFDIWWKEDPFITTRRFHFTRGR